MMSCLSASRGYPQRTTRVGIKSLPSSCPPTQPQPQTSQSACSSAVSDGKCSISSSETSSSPVVLTKKPRSRRRRPHEIYNEAAAALSAIYPKIFSCPPNKQQQQQQQNNSSNSTAIAGKKSKRSLYADDDSELLQEVPTFVRRARDMELLLFCNQSGAEAEAKSKSTDFQGQVPDNSLAHSPTPSSDAKSQSQSQSQSEMVAMSPSCVDYCCDWDDLSTVEYDCLLDSSDDAIDAGIMSAIMGDSGEASSSSADNGCVVPDAVAVAVVAGEAAAAQQRLQCSAIRSLRRASDCMSAPVSDFHGRSRLRILDRVMADKYKNSSSSNSMMSLCSLDWLKAEVAAAPRRLKLKLNYEDVLSAWSDRGPLFADDSAASPHFGFVDSAFGSMAAAGYGYDWVPDMSFWRSVDENGMYGQMDDRACFGEDGMLAGSGVREASVLRYKEKRRTRLFSKKIRYEVRKLNAERRPRMKGRFVRRLSDI